MIFVSKHKIFGVAIHLNDIFESREEKNDDKNHKNDK